MKLDRFAKAGLVIAAVSAPALAIAAAGGARDAGVNSAPVDAGVGSMPMDAALAPHDAAAATPYDASPGAMRDGGHPQWSGRDASGAEWPADAGTPYDASFDGGHTMDAERD